MTHLLAAREALEKQGYISTVDVLAESGLLGAGSRPVAPRKHPPHLDNYVHGSDAGSGRIDPAPSARDCVREKIDHILATWKTW